jgi:hypothetical protein
MYNFIATKIVEAISYRNEIVMAINGIIATKILLHYMIFIATKNFVVKTYYHGVYCNGLQRLTFVAIKVYCNEMKVIATKNFVAINLFSCSEEGLEKGCQRGMHNERLVKLIKNLPLLYTSCFIKKKMVSSS